MMCFRKIRVQFQRHQDAHKLAPCAGFGLTHIKQELDVGGLT